MTTFRGWLVEKTTDADGADRQSASFQDIDTEILATGDTWIDVAASSINFKDALALMGRPGIAKSWPLIPGIDIVGTVRESESRSEEHT